MYSNFEEVSYIRPRDPSIQNFNRMNLRRVNLQFTDETVQHETLVEELAENCEENYIPTYLRLKPNKSEDYKIKQNHLIYRNISEHREAIYKEIIFSKIYGAGESQSKIFDEVVKLRVFDFLSGKNSTVFIYGAPGAGSSYTTIGTERDPGFLPRGLEYIFKTLPKLPDLQILKPSPEGKVLKLSLSQRRLEEQFKTSIIKSQKVVDRLKNVTLYQCMQETLKNDSYASLEQLSEVSIGVSVSFLEICNEEIYDVLERHAPKNGERKKMRLGISNGKSYVKDLTYVCVSNAIEAFQIYQYGMQKVKSSNMISHSIFTIWMASTKSDCITSFLSSFNICNLTSGDIGRNDNKLQHKERYSANNSLMVLGKCINTLEVSLRNPNIKRRISCRESKLSLFFQRALSGLEDFCIFINIDPSKEAYLPTMSVLNFSALKKELVPKESFWNQCDQEQRPQLAELESEYKELQETLLETKSSYEELKRNCSTNIELELQALKEGISEIYIDADKIFEMKKEHLEEQCEQEYQKELAKMRNNIHKKMKKKAKKNNNDLLKNLKAEFKHNEVELSKLRFEVTELENKLLEMKRFSFEIQSREKMIAAYQANLEETTNDSVSKSETSLELNETCNENEENQVEKSENELSIKHSSFESQSGENLIAAYQANLEETTNDSVSKSEASFELNETYDENKVEKSENELSIKHSSFESQSRENLIAYQANLEETTNVSVSKSETSLELNETCNENEENQVEKSEDELSIKHSSFESQSRENLIAYQANLEETTNVSVSNSEASLELNETYNENKENQVENSENELSIKHSSFESQSRENLIAYQANLEETTNDSVSKSEASFELNETYDENQIEKSENELSIKHSSFESQSGENLIAAYHANLEETTNDSVSKSEASFELNETYYKNQMEKSENELSIKHSSFESQSRENLIAYQANLEETTNDSVSKSEASFELNETYDENKENQVEKSENELLEMKSLSFEIQSREKFTDTYQANLEEKKNDSVLKSLELNETDDENK